MRSIPETLIEEVRQVLVTESLAPGPVGVAYSGGMDSSVLLWAVCQVINPQNVIALHVDHGIRSPEEREAENLLVNDETQLRGCGLVCHGPPENLENSRGLEVAARDYRYHFFISEAKKRGLGAIFLAHHADDQAETIFMRLVKGNSWDGLSGMAPRLVREGVLFLRPFLGISRSCLAETAASLSLSFWADSTNQNPQFQRNYIRNVIFPLMEARFPQFRGSLVKMGRLWKRHYPRQILDSRWVERENGIWELPDTVWNGWNPEERTGQLLRVLDRVGGTLPISRRFLENLVHLGAPQGRGGEGGGYRLVFREGKILWGKSVAETPVMGYFVRAYPDIPFEWGNMTLSFSPKLGSGKESLFIPGIEGKGPLVWKTRVPGERFDLGEEKLTGKGWQKHRESPSLVYILDGGQLKAVVDLQERRLVWPWLPGGKLQSLGIFVTFSQRSDS